MKTYKLDGEKVEYYVYSCSQVNAYYDNRSKRICIHEELERLLSEDELKAIIYHEQNIESKALSDHIL